ncbi:MAG: DsbA family oxidoreductase [Pseudomonadota bacterium]
MSDGVLERDAKGGADDDAPPKMHVDVISDVMCPWCYIGKRRLEMASDFLDGDIDLIVHWRPFQLDATLPDAGLDRKTYLENKFGGPQRAAEIYAQIREAGAEERIKFRFDDITVSPNTLNAHRLIRFAGETSPDVQDAVVEDLFDRFFLRGEHIGDLDVLGDAADQAGMDRDATIRRLASDEARAETSAEVERAHTIGVTGVPCFIFDQSTVVMGAHPADHLANAARHALLQRTSGQAESA